ncbi:galactose-1-phosphate uridylyltransferase [Corynebacterium pseudodiphtheriticum]|uniref:galactose-1-phosphate uridylyltransferase n=1 Tax=Corynebacterium pseudodiphtheriticum TaxID=37637 RepID=UPI00254D12C3|nr:galactose-1-phosphate uridylyltransferase [Corynebacterium pseudodiphtheriticum]MDK8583704.1 galactose-1-phosphate uridylyltransferase [Corynebacterium pseudodiphtheriticum]MDK8839626.1 galactose-1-phosphate uridylyltransferase [Corynebacterium pseudodiphtheriticum]
MQHPMRITRTQLADGRELLYFDDTPEFVSGERTRTLVDERELPAASSASELRQDPMTGAWYTYAAHRMNRTFLPPANENPLAPTRPGQLPTEIPADDYDVVVFQNRFPSLAQSESQADLGADSGLDAGSGPATGTATPVFVPSKPGHGRCEVVCFTPDSQVSFRDLPYTRARTIVEAWAHRTKELSELPGIEYVYPFENRGEEIGVTLQHPHGQIYAYPFVPERAAQIATRAQEFREAQGGSGAGTETGPDLFDHILECEHADGQRVVVQGEYFTAFVPVAAKWPVEIMLVPHRAVPNFAELHDAEKDELTQMYLDILGRMDRFFDGVERTPYIASWNQAPVNAPENGRLHLQLFSLMRSPGRMKFLAGSESGQGAWISDTTPERIAARFREVADIKEIAENEEIAEKEVADHDG